MLNTIYPVKKLEHPLPSFSPCNEKQATHWTIAISFDGNTGILIFPSRSSAEFCLQSFVIPYGRGEKLSKVDGMELVEVKIRKMGQVESKRIGKLVMYTTDHYEYESGPGPYPCAVVQFDDGTVESFPVNDIRIIGSGK